MITSTLLAVLFTPVFFATFQWLAELRRQPALAADAVTANGMRPHAADGEHHVKTGRDGD